MENGEMSVQSIGEMGKDFCPKFLQPFLEYIDRRSCNDEAGSLFQYFTTFFFGGGSHLGEPRRGALEWEEEKKL